MMEDENAVTPTLCFTQVHLVDVPNTRDQILSDQRRSKLLSVNSIHPYKWKSKRMPATYLRCMHNNNLKMKTAGYSCRPQ